MLLHLKRVVIFVVSRKKCKLHRCKLRVVLEHYKLDCASLHEMASLCVLNTKYYFPLVFMTVVCFLLTTGPCCNDIAR